MCSQKRIYDIDVETIYQVERIKEDYEELEENYKLSQKELKTRTRQCEALKRDNKESEQKRNLQREQFEQVLKVYNEEKDVLLAKIQQLDEELEKHKLLLEEAEKIRLELSNKQTPVTDDDAVVRETNKQTREFQYKLKMAEQENSTLQTAVNRLENQVTRYKELLKEAETVEGGLKAEKRVLQKKLREAQAKNEELETNNVHLQKRLDRITVARTIAKTT